VWLTLVGRWCLQLASETARRHFSPAMLTLHLYPPTLRAMQLSEAS
jgi:hypothetical protein